MLSRARQDEPPFSAHTHLLAGADSNSWDSAQDQSQAISQMKRLKIQRGLHLDKRTPPEKGTKREKVTLSLYA